jgi:hypothetical protein
MGTHASCRTKVLPKKVRAQGGALRVMGYLYLEAREAPQCWRVEHLRFLTPLLTRGSPSKLPPLITPGRGRLLGWFVKLLRGSSVVPKFYKYSPPKFYKYSPPKFYTPKFYFITGPKFYNKTLVLCLDLVGFCYAYARTIVLQKKLLAGLTSLVGLIFYSWVGNEP